MRCPKCQYISFDNGERCRNCGYDLSLTVDLPAPDLRIAAANPPEGPLGDLALDGSRPSPPRAPDTASDLPLFGRASGDRPLVAPAAVPRAPLAVRRSNPAAARGRGPTPDEPTLDLGTPEGSRPRHRDGRLHADAAPAHGDPAIASLVLRMAAAILDGILIAAIHAAVIYLTLRLCGLTLAELRALPPVPLAAFLLLLAGGYLVSFTVAGGQTIGKMAAGIRVVPIAEREPGTSGVTLGSALLRAVGCLISILTAGLGYVPALVSQDHRALHDRLADTRVVRG